MADKTARLPDNAKGKWYVDSSCIGCGLCTSTAPEIFALNDGGQASVVRQPETAEETDLARQAQADCPVQAIGDDGDL
jgi:ferredoxin